MQDTPSSGEPGSNEPSSAGTGFSETRKNRLRSLPSGMGQFLFIWNRIAPFFISAALFLSGFFAIFSPLPFLILGVSAHWSFVFAAVAMNSVIVYFMSGPTVFQFYLLTIGSIGLAMPFLIRHRQKPESIVARTWIIQWCLVGMFIGVYALLHRMTIWDEFRRIFSGFFDMLLASLAPETRDKILENFGGGEAGKLEWRTQTLKELPGTLGIICLVLTWFNLRVLVNLNPGRILPRLGVDRRVLNRWKNADWLVWPTLGAWAVVLFCDGTASDVALNIFKVLLTAYGLQGLAVMGSAFDAYRVGGFIRIFLYSLVLLVLLPLLLSIGFFDQWFDFRAKFRQIS